MGIQICRRYVVLFLCLVMLTEQNEETMIFSKCAVHSRQQTDFTYRSPLRSLLRLRQELTRLIETHTGKLSEVPARARARSAIYEELLRGLTVSLDRLPLDRPLVLPDSVPSVTPRIIQERRVS